MAEQKIKVRVSQLIESVEKRKAELTEKHASLMKEYEEEVATLDARRMAAVDSYVATARKTGQWNYTNYGYGLRIEDFPETPSRPKLDVQAIDRDLNLLRLSADEFIQVGIDNQWNRYL